METFRFIEGFMPLQFLLELVGIVLVFTGVAALLERVSYPINRFFKAVLVFVTFVLYLTYRVYPPMPFSILATYITVRLLAVLLWASSSDAYWQEFKQPIVAVVDAETLHTRVLRAVLVLLIPCLAGWFTWPSMQTKIDEPVELRTVIPAPPNTFTAFVQLRTILYVEEGHEFWRTAGGGPVLPTEGFPWVSVMPANEEHLTADEIWKILLFKSWFTGGDPAWGYERR